MKYISIFIISIALAMDAFSVSICKGVSLKYKVKRNSFLIALSFSFFQMIMPLIGYFLGNKLNNYFFSFSHLITFFILVTIGINMIKESYNKEDINIGLSIKELLSLSIATSIDALAIGITFALLKINILLSILTIGIITFILCIIGLFIGKIIGNKYENKAQIIGGIILIIMGIKSIVEYFIK